ncbi:hypothetical protein [Salinisphaera sp. T31B1]|uniref:hypothetical protein n=1 Tax=Salinisphaera sp. T31B1 TaxID=727963 RepID=UPI00333E4646
MTVLFVVCGLAGTIGLVLLVRAAGRLRRRRVLAAGRSGIGAGLCLALAGLAVAIGINVHSYARLTHEQPLAHLHLTQTGIQQYRGMLVTADERLRIVDLTGDEWQLDARVLKWHGWANLLGLDALYRLDRIGGRYRDIGQANREPTRAIALHGPEAGLDILALARRLPRWATFVDAEYGSATYLPMADGAEYEIALGQAGLIARPVNPAAQKAVRRW